MGKFNLFTAMLSFGKQPKSAKFEIIKPPLSHTFCMSAWKDFYRNGQCIVLKIDLLLDLQMYCLQACMCAFFSLEILQTEAVKGLRN